MKNLTINHFLFLVAISVLIVIGTSCETTMETYDEFVKEGETIYIGTADTVVVGSGFNKLRFWVAINADPKIKKGYLESSNSAIKHEFEIQRNKPGKDTVQFDLDLPEGEYTFGLYLKDDAGHSSVRKEVPATVFGEKYRASLISRSVQDIAVFKDYAIVNWSQAAANIQYTIIKYEDRQGDFHTIEVENQIMETTLHDYKRGGQFSVTSSFQPNENAIEIFVANTLEDEFPNEYLINKSDITALKLPFDASDGCYGSSYTRLTDGSFSEYWHSCEDSEINAEDLYPWVMSFDLGSPALISRFRLDERADCCGERSPAAYQIWVTNEIGGGITGNIDEMSLEDWEQDAIAKGWIKALDVNGNSQPTFEVDINDLSDEYQYVRLVGISSIGGGLSANFNEFTFWGK